MEQFFAEGFVAILVVLGGLAAPIEITHDVLLESDNNVSDAGFILVVLGIALCILAWIIIRLIKLLNSRRTEVQNILNQITDGFVKVDQEFRYLSVNKRAAEMVHMQPSEMIGKSIWELFPDAVSSVTYNAFVEAMKTRHATRVMDYYQPLDLWYENNIYPTENGLTIFIRDVTDQKRAEKQLFETGKLYKTIASTIPGSLISVLDKDYRFILLEGDLFGKLGYSKDTMVHERAIDAVLKERYDEIEPYFKRAFGGESFSIETRRQNFDLLTRYVPMRDENNEVTSIMIVSIDVTPLKEAERRVAELNIDLERRIAERTAELESVNKDLESFSYSVAHDLRAPLRAVEGYTTMLYEDYSTQLDEEAHRLMTHVKENANRMTTLIDELLAFSKLGKKEIRKSNVDMRILILRLLDELPKNKATICVGELHPVFGDFTLLQNVIMNLLSNAIKYSSKKEKPRITISSEAEGASVVYTIADNGVGFDMKFAQNLFGVFQRLHSLSDFEGTGVGLAIVQKIINKHGGRVWAHAEVNKGATFHFTLPTIPLEQL